MTTLESPLHSAVKPSARDIVTMALDMPLYMALGEGLTICILVCLQVSASPTDSLALCQQLRTLSKSTGYITECSYDDISRSVSMEARSEAYGDTCERAREHVRREGEVGRERFIAGTSVSNGVGRQMWCAGAVLVFVF